MSSAKMVVWRVLCSYVIMASMSGIVYGWREFKVGGELGWQEPGMNDTALYGQWAARNRFQVGDSLSFEYKNDSVLEVDKWGYYHCNASKPIATFTDGKSVVNLDRPGAFYFISGNPDHCRSGQRLIVEVMGLHHHNSHSPPSFSFPPESNLAPSPQQSSGALISVTLGSVFMVLITTFVTLEWCAP